MQYQIPVPHPPVQGPTVQRTDPIARFGEPVLARYPGRIYPGANVYLHQGPTVQQTHPVPKPAPIEFNAYQALRNSVRPYTVALMPLQGTTIQRTDPIARFGEVVFSRYPARQQLVEAQDLGVISTDIYRLPLPNLTQWPGRQQPTEAQAFEGATIQATNPIPGVALIEMRWYTLAQSARLIPGAITQVHQGATVQSTDRIPGVDKIELSRYSLLNFVRAIPGAIVYRHQGATVSATDPIPPVAQLEMSRYSLLKDAMVRRLTQDIQPVDGPSIQSTDPIPGVDKIQMRRFSALEAVRLIPGAIPQFSGATIQATHPIPMVFGRSGVYPRPQFPALAPVIMTSAQTYVFTLPQPNLAAWELRFPSSSVSRTESIFPPITTSTVEDKVNLGMRFGVNQSDIFMGGFG